MKRIAKVCMLLNAKIWGDQRVFKEARTLVDAGYDLTILCNQEAKRSSRAWDGIKIVSIPRHWSLLSPGRFTYEWIRKAILLCPDIIHAHDLNTLGRGWLVSRLMGAKLIYDSHDYYQQTPFVLRMPRWRRWYYRRKERFLIRRADRVIHVVPELAPIIAQEFRISEPVMIANYPMGDSAPRSRILNEMFKLPLETRIIIYEGMLAKDRGLEKLVSSAQHLPQGIVIVFLGEGYLKEKLEQLTVENKVEDRVKFIDKVCLEEFPIYCSAANIGIAIYENKGLSWEYGWATKVFDYMRAGIPTLISGSRATEKLVLENDVGIVMDDTTPEGIAKSIVKMFADREQYNRLRHNSLVAWKRKFNWKLEGEKLVKLYEQLEDKKEGRAIRKVKTRK